MKTKRIFGCVAVASMVILGGGVVRPAAGMEVSEFLEAVRVARMEAEGQDSLGSARLVFTEDFSGEVRPDVVEAYRKMGAESKVYEANQTRRFRQEVALDAKGNQTKVVITDLRDLDSVLKRYGLGVSQKPAVCLTRTILSRESYDLSFAEQGVGGGKPFLFFSQNPLLVMKKKSPMSLLLWQGFVDEKLLTDLENARVSEVTVKGRKLLRMERDLKKGEHTSSLTIDCDPALGYRFRRIESRGDGRPYLEWIADDYRTINGIPYPFCYRSRMYDVTREGKVLQEEKMVFEKVEFGIKFAENEFKILVPKGTAFQDNVTGKPSTEFQRGTWIGIADLLGKKAAGAAGEGQGRRNDCGP